jgi:hypothetical protein
MAPPILDVRCSRGNFMTDQKASSIRTLSGNARPSHASRTIAPRRVALTTALLLCLAVYARADFVSGHVYGPDNKPISNGTFSAQTTKGQPVSFKTDGAGSFSVYLEPGTYTVHSATDKAVEGVVHGYPQSAEEDIHLKRK